MATDINTKKYNQFRAADAFEFVNVTHIARGMTLEQIEARLAEMARAMARKDAIVTTLQLAGYRAYESMSLVKRGLRPVEIVIMNVELDD